jgi:hypothetical protein
LKLFFSKFLSVNIEKLNYGLCARLLNAKYYPFGKLTDTAFIKNALPCWQGITHGLELLKQGVDWRIINGKKTRIGRDNWIPRG